MSGSWSSDKNRNLQQLRLFCTLFLLSNDSKTISLKLKYKLQKRSTKPDTMTLLLHLHTIAKTHKLNSKQE